MEYFLPSRFSDLADDREHSHQADRFNREDALRQQAEADHREMSLLRAVDANRADRLQRDNDSLRQQLNQANAAITTLIADLAKLTDIINQIREGTRNHVVAG